GKAASHLARGKIRWRRRRTWHSSDRRSGGHAGVRVFGSGARRRWRGRILRTARPEEKRVPDRDCEREAERDQHPFLGIHRRFASLCRRNRIYTARIQTVTPKQSPHAEVQTAPRPVDLERLKSIRRAGRMKTAGGGQNRRDGPSIQADRESKNKRKQ